MAKTQSMFQGSQVNLSYLMAIRSYRKFDLTTLPDFESCLVDAVKTTEGVLSLDELFIFSNHVVLQLHIDETKTLRQVVRSIRTKTGNDMKPHHKLNTLWHSDYYCGTVGSVFECQEHVNRWL